MEKALLIWAKGRKETADMFLKNISKEVWDSRPFLIKPYEIKWFNEELYGKEGTEVFGF